MSTVSELKERGQILSTINQLNYKLKSCSSKLEALPIIKAYYNLIQEDIFEARSTGHNIDVYQLNILQLASPIERHLWNSIRCLGLPFIMEYPVLNYFIDFADPYLKVGIEADGKEFHNSERDKIRDKELSKIGWKIYRITGSQIMREQDRLPSYEKLYDDWEYGEYFNEEEFKDYRRRKLSEHQYFTEYLNGIMEEINNKHYKKVFFYG